MIKKFGIYFGGIKTPKIQINLKTMSTRNNNNIDTESKLRKFLKDEISTVLLFIGFISTIILFTAGIQQDIALIQKDINIINTNHLTHIQAAVEENAEKNKEQDDCLKEISDNLIKIMVHMGIEQ